MTPEILEIARKPNSQRTPLEKLVYAHSLVLTADELFAEGHRVKKFLAEMLAMLKEEIMKLQPSPRPRRVTGQGK